MTMNAEFPLPPTHLATPTRRNGLCKFSKSQLLSTPRSHRTPPRSTSRKKAAIPRMSPSPRVRRTPVSVAKLATSDIGDRFIPSRRSLNVDMCRRSLFSKETIHDDVRDDTPSSRQRALFNKSLLSSLCDYPIESLDDNAKPKSLFRSRNRESPTHGPETLVRLEDPYSHSILGGNFTRSGRANGISMQQKSSCKVSTKAFKVLDAPGIKDDYYTDHLSWNSSNVLAITLDNTVYLYDYTSGAPSELTTYDGGRYNYVSTVSWCNSRANSTYLAIGTNFGAEIWDTQSAQRLRNLRGHRGRVLSLSWNQHCLTTGGQDGGVLHHDVRCRNSLVARCLAHEAKVVGLTWNREGDMLASGGNDDMLCIWELRMSSGRNRAVEPRLKLRNHTSAVKAIDWNPHQRGLLASGGGANDKTIKILNSQSGTVLSSTETGSQVSSLIWSQHCNGLCSSHGYSDNLLTLWNYERGTGLTKTTDFVGHSSPILSTACSPNGRQVVSAGADEALRFWDVFDEPVRKRSLSVVSSIWGEVSLQDSVIR